MESELIKRPLCDFQEPGVPEDIVKFKHERHIKMVDYTLKQVKKEEKFLKVAMKSQFEYPTMSPVPRIYITLANNSIQSIISHR